MSQTRHARPEALISHERYMSSPEFAELRGIGGAAVAARAALLDHPAKRSLLFFLQAMSLKDGGLKKFCAQFLEQFADCIGTPSMNAARSGRKPGFVFSNEVALQIQRELDPDKAANERRVAQRAEDAEYARRLLAGDEDNYEQPVNAPETVAPAHRTFQHFFSECQRHTESLPAWLVELCVNPALQFNAPGEPENPSASQPWFKDVIGALYDYRRLHDEAVRAEFAETDVSRRVFETLDFALKTRKMVLIEGDARIGKTTATEAWCNRHLGEVRFVSLSGVSHKTGLFRALAKVLGIGSSLAKSATEIQTRVESVLQRSGLMVVIDEAHYLFSAAERVYSRPELLDWANTSLYNQGVPVGFVCTPQFRERLARVEKQTGYNADQFRGRCKRVTQLPPVPRKEDLIAVARKLLPVAANNIIQLIVGYALVSKRHFPALVDVVDEASLICQKAARTEITLSDCKTAIEDFCVPTAAAWAVPPAQSGRRSRRTPGAETGTPIPPDQSPEITPARSGHDTHFADQESADNLASGVRSAPPVRHIRGEAAQAA